MMKKVIIIDDSATSLNLLKTTFAKNSWEVYGAQNAKIAYEMIYDVAPDIIITDAIMPVMGGFQLLKTIRDDDAISKIPVIVYSILNESNAKFYIHEELSEYFLRKDDNVDELLKMAIEITNKYPLDEDYKKNILTVGLNFAKTLYKKEEETQIIQKEAQEEIIEDNIQKNIDEEELNKIFKENYDFHYSDEKIFSEIFTILYPLLEYDLFTINVYSYEKKEQSVFFDIRDIILSPIFQNKILTKYNAQDIILFKKYAPNLKMIINEDEFFSKIEFNFEYKEVNIANVAIYSKDKQKWQNEHNIETIKNILYKFFKARYINKNSLNNKKETYQNRYSSNKLDINFLNKFDETQKEDLYLGIVEVVNFSEIESSLSEEELDIINSKISEKIINYLEKDEQVYKNDKDEYIIVIFAKDEKQAKHKFMYIANTLNQISYESYSPEVVIGVSNCNISNSFNTYEAQKIARNALDLTSKQEKVVIKWMKTN